MESNESTREVELSGRPRDSREPWRDIAAAEDAQEASELAAMSEQQLDAEFAEELGPVQRWMQDNVGAAEFANELYPDLLDIDEARQAVENPDT